MSTPRDDQPTTVIPQQTVEQPAVTTAPGTSRTRVWQRKIPARIGRARTSTVIIGCLFVLLGGLNFVLPQQVSGTTDVVLPSGRTVAVPNSALPSEARSTTTPVTTTTAPATTAPAPTTRTPSSTTPAEDDDPAPTTAGTTSRTTSAPAPSTTSSTPATTSRAPSTTAAPEETEEEPTPEETAEPTG